MGRIKKAFSDDGFTTIESSDAEGSTIGPYKLLQKLGEGGFGEVWMAEQREPVKRRVALKVIKLGMDTRQVVARFEAERQALAMMDHPNIAKVFDAGSTETGRPYFVMELVRGVSVTEYCETHRIAVPERLELFSEICSAVQHAHQKGIIHRDIKPSNILVALHEGRPVPKVIDFGIAKATQQQLTDKTVVTQMQQFIGTPAYMSPEQAEMSGLDIDTRTDIYSLGVLLYELLTGQTPFDKKELLSAGWEQMRRIIREKDPPRPSTRLSQQIAVADGENLLQTKTLVQRLRGDLDWIVMKCLEKDRTRRYETANGLALDIQRHLRNEAVLARPPTATYRLQKLVRRNRAVFAVGFAFAALLIGTALFSTASYVRERAARAEAERQRSLADQARTTAQDKTRQALQEQEKARRNLYFARMNLLQADWEHNDFTRFRATLEQTKDFPERGFEWNYWQRMSHLELFDLNVSNSVWSLSISSDGKLLAGSGSFTRVACWDLQSGRLRWQMSEVSRSSRCAFSPDGKILAVADGHGAVTLLDSRNGAALKHVPPYTEEADLLGFREEVAWSSDGRLVAAIGARTIRIFRGSDLTLERTIPDNAQVRGLAFSRNGQLFAACDTEGNIRIFDHLFQPVAEFKRDTCLNKILFTADSKNVIVSGNDSKVVVLDVQSGQILRTFDRQPGIIRAMDLTSDGRALLTGSEDNSAILWDLATGEPIRSFKGHTSYVWGCAISPDDQLVATGDATGVIKVWQTQVPGPITLENAPDGSDLAVFTPKLDKVVAANAQYGSGLWETTLGKRVETLGKEFRSTTWLEGASFSADGSKLFLTGGSGLMSGDLWELSPGGETKHLWHIERPCTAGMLSADAECVAIGETNGAVTILNLKTRTPERSLSFTTNRIFNVVLSPDRRLVAASDYADAVCVWRLPSGEKAFASGGGAPSRLAFMNHSPKLVGWSANEVQIWNCEKGQRELHFETPNSWALAISPDDRRIATSGTWGNPTIQLWDTVTGEETLRLRTITEIIVRLAFSADGKRLGAITHQSRVQFWDAE